MPLGAPEAEVRKTVTVVFCDLVGSTALGERVDAEVLRSVMGGFHAELRQVLEQHGGTVEKFVGDAVMAVFGIPQVHEDDALRAVQAAIRMRDAAHGLGLEVRIGVNTGEVVAGAGETLVTGDAVNVAARLEQHAPAGQILVGEGTERLVRPSVLLEPVEALAVRGKSEPVPAFRVAGLADQPDSAVGAAALVGRGDELALLEEVLRLARDKRAPALVTVVGAPGVGKTRLVAELLGSVSGQILVGRCLSYGDGITYWPIVEILEALGDVEAALDGVDDAALVSGRLAAALGTPGAAASPEEIAWAFRRLLESLSRDSLVVVAFDDIHWAEPALLDLIEYVSTFTQDAALVLLCTARPELFDVRPSWATPRPNSTLVQLEPLGPGDAAALVAELGELPGDVLLKIVEASDGNPLFVEQLVALHQESPTSELEVPPTLQALLAARIDRLEAEERLVVERASIEGRLFHRGAVMELLPEHSRPDAAMRLVALIRRELIRPDRATIRGDDGFRFGHLLIRDAAYESMSKRVRAGLHERYADWVVACLADGAPQEIVGYHLEQAYRYLLELGEEAGDLGDRAAAVLGAAGRSAMGRRDVAAAGKLFARAAALAREPARRHLLLEYACALRDSGDPQHEAEVLVEVVRLAETAGDDRSRWLAQLLEASRRMVVEPEGAASAARATAEAAIEEAAADDHQVLGRSWGVLADVHAVHGRLGDEMTALDRALDHAREAGDRLLEIELSASYQGALVYGPVSVNEGFRKVGELMGRTGGVVAVQMMAQHVLAHLDARQGRLGSASEALAARREHLRELGQERAYAVMATCAWDVFALGGEVEAGELALLEGYTILERMGDKGTRCTIAGLLGEAAYRQGRLDDAARYAELSEELGARDDLMNEALWRSVRAKVLSARGDHQNATELAAEAVECAATTDLVETQADAHLDQATVLLAAGDPAAAAAAAGHALSLYRGKGNEVSAARASAFLDRLAAAGA